LLWIMSGNVRAIPHGPCGVLPMQAPIAVTILDAVKATGMSRTSLYEALKRGDLTARKAGRRTLISFADLEAYLARLPTYQAGA
jgi:excisionase family DNA binding protein